MDILIATNNRHKKEEIARILRGHTILLPEEIGASFDYHEPFDTFHENAFGKGMTMFRQTGGRLPVLADDSGLCVRALGYAPGVKSARYGFEEGKPALSAREQIDLLLANLRGAAARSAFFLCSMVLILEEYRFFHVQETVWGEIIEEPRGEGGFGYDPVFLFPDIGKTMSEVSMEEKNRRSHRGKAGAAVLKLIGGME